MSYFENLDDLNIRDILIQAIEQNASDVHIVPTKPPVFRLNGVLVEQGVTPLNKSVTDRLARETMSEKIERKFDEELEVDYSYSIEIGDISYRFRVNTFTQRGTTSMALRLIPNKIKSIEELRLPPVITKFTALPRGLVLVTGPTGSGKSTTLASMIDAINSTKPLHIMTLEDPIEYMHINKMGVVNQREIGQDSTSFHRALKSVLRQDPDVILLGEMRDLETISTAVTLAETGHLVYATLHTQTAPQTIDRIIDVFPGDQQEQIRTQLANVLEAVITQTLIPTKEGNGRICACEILVMTAAARSNIRNNKTNSLNDIMTMGSKYGMQTLDQCLANYVKQDLITKEVAIETSSHIDTLEQLLKSINR